MYRSIYCYIKIVVFKKLLQCIIVDFSVKLQRINKTPARVICYFT